MKINWHDVITWLQVGLTWFVIVVIVACVSVLILFDVLAGTGVNLYLTRNNMGVSIIISMATTGLLLALMFLGYQAQKRQQFRGAGWALLAVSAVVYLIDTYFDSLGADVLRYQVIVSLDGLNEVDRNIHILYRLLIGGISTVGEPLATAIIAGMPVLVEIIENAMPVAHRAYSQTQAPRAYHANANSQAMEKLQQSMQQRPAPQPRPERMPVYGEPTYHPVSYKEQEKG